jgi:single-strand DNA-binding protein
MSTPVTLTGRLTADPELAYTKQGKAFARFTVVTSRRFKNDQTSEWEDRDTSFWRCVVFGQIAENVTESLLKGTAVVAQGSARQNNWETKEGEKRSSTEVIVDDIAPSLRWASAKVMKAGREKPTQPAADDPWRGEEPPF